MQQLLGNVTVPVDLKPQSLLHSMVTALASTCAYSFACAFLFHAGIKVALPCESASGRCFLQLYIESILALQEASGAAAEGRSLPLAIMTSDDTHARTEALLKKRHYFGMKSGQVGFTYPYL